MRGLHKEQVRVHDGTITNENFNKILSYSTIPDEGLTSTV